MTTGEMFSGQHFEILAMFFNHPPAPQKGPPPKKKLVGLPPAIFFNHPKNIEKIPHTDSSTTIFVLAGVKMGLIAIFFFCPPPHSRRTRGTLLRGQLFHSAPRIFNSCSDYQNHEVYWRMKQTVSVFDGMMSTRPLIGPPPHFFGPQPHIFSCPEQL